MNKQIKAKWVKALRSGKFNQTRNYLKMNGGYCCLGVLRHVMNPDDTAGATMLLGSQLHKAGLSAGDAEALAECNDFQLPTGVPFEMIAGLVNEAL